MKRSWIRVVQGALIASAIASAAPASAFTWGSGEEVSCLSRTLWQHARAHNLSKKTLRLIGAVVMARVYDPRYPNTVCTVVFQTKPVRQFFWTRGAVYPGNGSDESAATRALARELIAAGPSSLPKAWEKVRFFRLTDRSKSAARPPTNEFFATTRLVGTSGPFSFFEPNPRLRR